MNQIITLSDRRQANIWTNDNLVYLIYAPRGLNRFNTVYWHPNANGKYVTVYENENSSQLDFSQSHIRIGDTNIKFMKYENSITFDYFIAVSSAQFCSIPPHPLVYEFLMSRTYKSYIIKIGVITL